MKQCSMIDSNIKERHIKHLRSLLVQDSNYFNHIEGLRALAGLSVVWFHFVNFLQLFVPADLYLNLLHHRILGFALANSVCLDVFFLISGYVISYSLMREFIRESQINWRHFFARRIARLYPSYLLLLILCIPFSLHTSNYLWANILQINNHLPLSHQYLPWTWSLAVEFQFYVLIALALSTIKNWHQNKFLLYFLIALIFVPTVLTVLFCVKNNLYYLNQHFYLVGHEDYLKYFNHIFDKLLYRMSPIIIGLIAGYLTAFHREKIVSIIDRFSTLSISLVSILFLSIATLVIANDPWWSVQQHLHVWQASIVWSIAMRMVFSFSLAGMLLLCLHPRGIVKGYVVLLGSPLWRPFGQLAYNAFLIHPLVISFVFSAHIATHSTISAHDLFRLALLTYGWTYALATVIYLCVEMPMLVKVRKKLIGGGISALS